MEPEKYVKIYVNKLGAQLKRAEKKVASIEETLEVAKAAVIQVGNGLKAARREVMEMKQTWERVAKEMKEMEDRRKMEESLQEDFPIDEVDIGLDGVRSGDGGNGAGEEMLGGDRGEELVANGEVKIERSGKEEVEGCRPGERAEKGGLDQEEAAENDEEMKERRKDEEENETMDTQMTGNGPALWS